MSPEVASETNGLDIDDGTMPVADAAQADDTAEEVDQIDDNGDVDGGQVSEAEEPAAAEPAEPAEPADKAEDKNEDKPQGIEKPAEDAKPDEWKQYAEQIREEFGETAAKPIEAMIAKMEEQDKAIKQLVGEREAQARNRDMQIAVQHMSAAGIKPADHAEVYDEAVGYMSRKRQKGKNVSGMDALNWAIRAAGGNPEKAATATATTKSGTTQAEKAAKLQRLRSIEPKSREKAAEIDYDDPAIADGTAPVKQSR